jgi:DNA polymerase III epsilon subunit-like protein
MNNKPPKGFMNYMLVVDAETSGLAFNSDDPSHDIVTGKTYQSVSWGMLVVDVTTLKVIESLYVEIKWDGTSTWDKKAQAVHGLTIQHLEEHGVTPEEAVVQIASLVLKYWGPENPVCLAGHNVGAFDMWFLKRLLRAHNIHIKFGSRVVDTNSIGIAVYNLYNSDDLFTRAGVPQRDPTQHNALDDAAAALRVIRKVRALGKLEGTV